MNEIIIVGGGIHGTMMQLALRKAGLDPVVIDPEPPLENWKRNTRNCGMRFLRSTSSHSLDLDFHGLRRFAREHGYGKSHFIAPYLRPSLELFNAHADYLLESYDLGDRVTDSIAGIRKEARGYRLIGARGEYTAKRVILSIGTPPPVTPWEECGDRGLHVFDRRFDPNRIEREESVGIVGTGVTGGQLSVELARRGVREVTLIDLHEPRHADYDGNPCYIGPRCGVDFAAIPDAAARREVIRRERYPGTLPRDIYAEVDELRSVGRLRFELGKVDRIRPVGASVEATVCGDQVRTLSFDRVVATTGFAAVPPAPTVVADTAKRYGLERGPLGYPYPAEDLQWMDGLFVAGSLGELRIGPAARNVIGGHLALRRILPALDLPVSTETTGARADG